MFRKSQDEMNDDNNSADFLKRVVDLPMVQYVVLRGVDVYGKAKEYNGLVKFTLDTAEKTLVVASERAKPVVAKFTLPLNVANVLACKTLDNLEERLPIMTKNPEEIAAQTRKLYEDAIILPTLQRYNNVKQYGLDKVNAVKDYGIQKTNIFLDTKYGHMVVDKLDTLLLVADSYVDSYLPAIKTEEDHPDEPEMVEDSDTFVKATFLSAKLRKRMLVHGMIKFQASKKRITETLSNLHLVIDLLEALKSSTALTGDGARERLSQTKEKLLELWTAFNEGDPNQPGVKTLEQKVLYLTRTLSTQLYSAYQKMSSAAALLPEKLRPTITLTQQYVVDLYTQLSKATTLNEVSVVLIHEAREGVNALQATTLKLFDAINAKALSWLAGETKDERKVVTANGSANHAEPNRNELPSDDFPPNQFADSDSREEDSQQISFETKENNRNSAYSTHNNSSDHSPTNYHKSY